MKLTSEELLEIVVKAADDKLAQDIQVLDVHGLTSLADYFVVMNGRNEKQVAAIVESIVQNVAKNKGEVKNVEGKDSGKWTLIDLNDIIVHVFNYEERGYYNIEKLWSDAPLVDISGMVTEQ